MRGQEALEKYLEYLEVQGRARKTIYGYGRDLSAFQRFLEQRNNIPWFAEETTTDDVEVFLQFLYHDRGLQPASRNRILHCLKSFYKYLHSRGLCPTNPTYGVGSFRVNRRERSHLSEDEYSRIVEAIETPTIRIATQTLWYTGLRISELTHLTIESVDLPQQVIHVIGKGNDRRDIPIHHKLLPLLEQYVADHRASSRPFERFFALQATSALSPSHFNRELKRAVAGLGLKNVTAHTFRHSFATNLVRNGIHVVVIQKLLGHKSIAVTAVYTHADAANMTKAVNSL